MKKIILPLVVLTLVGFGIVNEKLTEEDREFAITEMTQSRDYLFDTLEGLSQEQLDFKTDETSWSIAECLEHITISETMIQGMLKGALKTPADPSRRPEVKMPDDALLGMIKSREKKVKTGEAFEPSGKYGSVAETLEAFKSKREEHIAYVKDTDDDLRNHYTESPLGIMDGLQVLLFMSGHTERHTKQMEEIMAHPDFPEK